MPYDPIERWEWEGGFVPTESDDPPHSAEGGERRTRPAEVDVPAADEASTVALDHVGGGASTGQISPGTSDPYS